MVKPKTKDQIHIDNMADTLVQIAQAMRDLTPSNAPTTQSVFITACTDGKLVFTQAEDISHVFNFLESPEWTYGAEARTIYFGQMAHSGDDRSPYVCLVIQPSFSIPQISRS